MIRVLIADDEPPARRKVRRFLERDAEIGAVAEAGSGQEALDAIRTFQPDLLLLDVQMPDMDGFAVLQQLSTPRDFVSPAASIPDGARSSRAPRLRSRSAGLPAEARRPGPVRARAGAGQTATGAADVSALMPKFQRRRMLVEKGGKEFFLPVEQLDWVESDRNYLCLHSGEETFLLRSTLESLARQLDPDQFARISRSELVNLDRIREMQLLVPRRSGASFSRTAKNCHAWTRKYRV